MKHQIITESFYGPKTFPEPDSRRLRYTFLSKLWTQTDDLKFGTHPVVLGVTVYNEPADAIRQTLEAIARNAEESEGQYGQFLTCIIVDGLQSMHPSTYQYLEELGLLDERLKPSQISGLHIFMRTISSAKLNSNDELISSPSASQDIKVLVCVKSENHGKLDSHWWLYHQIFPNIDLDYCFQIDAGTVPEPMAIARICDAFDQDQSVAAVASSVRIEASSKSSILEKLQSFDLNVQKALFWPLENCTRLLTVIPGQCSALRWSSMARPAAEDTPSPKDKYLRSLNAHSAFERIMYLAEDRVLSFELFAKKGSDHRIMYADDAAAWTDACQSVDELLRQRRRWINSAFACRVWALRSFGSYFRDSTSSFGNKCLGGAGALLLLIYNLIDLLTPLIAMLLILGLGQSLTTIAASANLDMRFVNATWLGLSAMILAPAALTALQKLQRWRPKTAERLFVMTSGAMVVTFATIIGAMFLSGASFGPLIFSAFSLVAAPIMAGFVQDKALGKLLARSTPLYLALAVPYNLMLHIYAVFNIDDDSWGTKGRAMPSKGKDARELKRLKWGFIALWFGLNAGLGIGLVATSQLQTAVAAAIFLSCCLSGLGLFASLAKSYCSKEKNVAWLRNRIIPTVQNRSNNRQHADAYVRMAERKWLRQNM